MGIPSYFSYVIKNYPLIIKKFEKHSLNINNLFLDCNSIIYDTYHKLDCINLTEPIATSIINQVIIKIEEYITTIKPSNIVMIAFDGVAPVAKLEQQRSRRYKSYYQNEVSKHIFNKSAKDSWNTGAITPGTKFMTELNEKITKYFISNKSIIVSGSNIYGEGEHKIFDYIRSNSHTNNETNVIYGLDADLIMLSINHLPVAPNIYLYRETPHFIQSIDSSLEPNASYVIDIPELSKNIVKYMINQNDIDIYSNINKNRLYDYIFLCFLLGNDFLPHFPALNIRTGGVDKMLNAYRATLGQTNETLINNNKIIWGNFRKLIQHLVTLEEQYIITEHKNRNYKERKEMPNETPEDKWKRFESTPLYERELEQYINPFKPNWQYRYYRSLFNIKSDKNNEQKRDIAINYLQGLEWTMKYYTNKCPDWRWRYKYNYPPLLEDLIRYIPLFDTTFIVNKEDNPVSEITQLCYVTPRQTLKELLPSVVYQKLLKKQDDWYKTDCNFIWAYCRYFWESHVEMNEISLNELEKIIS